MFDKQPRTERELKKLFTSLKKKGITDDMMHKLITLCYNKKMNLRTSGFYWPGAPDVVMEWDNLTRTLTLTPKQPDAGGTGTDNYLPHFRMYSWGGEAIFHRIYEIHEIQLPDQEGLFVVYFDSDEVNGGQKLFYIKNPTLAETASIYINKIVVALIYWSGSAIYFGDSRHGSEWNPQIHWSWHQTFNSVRQEGIAITDAVYDGDGSIDAHFQFGISEGKLWHEDILDSINAVGKTDSLPVWYFASGLPRYQVQAGKKFLNAGRVAFNSGGITQATNNYYVLYHLFATNCIYQEVISVMGQAQFEILGQAIAAINAEVATLKQQLPHSNLMWIDTVIIQTSDDFINSAKARIVTNACTVFTEMSITGDGSATDKIHLVNDEEDPDDLHFYGTGDHMEPEKGFHPLYSKLVYQPAHGFAEKDAIRHNGTIFVKAQADNDVNAQTAGIVVEIIDVDHFRYQSEGFYRHPDWIPGTEYFLSPTVAGLVTTEPLIYNIGEVRQSLGWGTDRGLKIEIDVGDVIGIGGGSVDVPEPDTVTSTTDNSTADGKHTHALNTIIEAKTVTNATVTVDVKGRVTALENGVAGGGTEVITYRHELPNLQTENMNLSEAGIYKGSYMVVVNVKNNATGANDGGTAVVTAQREGSTWGWKLQVLYDFDNANFSHNVHVAFNELWYYVLFSPTANVDVSVSKFTLYESTEQTPS